MLFIARSASNVAVSEMAIREFGTMEVIVSSFSKKSGKYCSKPFSLSPDVTLSYM